MPDPKPSPAPSSSEVVDAGQEEVFSRKEVELGRIEHPPALGPVNPPPKPGKTATGGCAD